MTLDDVRKVKRSGFPNVDAVLDWALGVYGLRKPAIAVSLAGPLEGDAACIYAEPPHRRPDWTLSASGLSRSRRTKAVVRTDFQALALGVAVSSQDDMVHVHGGLPTDDDQKLVIGPGTWLGMSCLFRANGVYHATASDGGNIPLMPPAGHDLARQIVDILGTGMPANDSLFHPKLAKLRPTLRRHVLAGAGVSGRGLVNLYQAYAMYLDGIGESHTPMLSSKSADPASLLTPENVSRLGLEGSDRCAKMAIDLFRSFSVAPRGRRR